MCYKIIKRWRENKENRERIDRAIERIVILHWDDLQWFPKLLFIGSSTVQE